MSGQVSGQQCFLETHRQHMLLSPKAPLWVTVWGDADWQHPHPKQHQFPPGPSRPLRPSFPTLSGGTAEARALRGFCISQRLLYVQPCGAQTPVCVRCFRSRERRHRHVIRPLKKGGSLGAKVITSGGEASGKTSWRWWHSVSLLVKNQGEWEGEESSRTGHLCADRV